MKSRDRMFRVLVLGGIALTACGDDGSPNAAGPDATAADALSHPGHDAAFDAFPHEGPDTGSRTMVGDGGDDAPPSADATSDATADAGFLNDAGFDATADAAFSDDGESDATVDAFPHEGPDIWVPPDAGHDASVDGGAADGGSVFDGFPQEGPLRIDP